MDIARERFLDESKVYHLTLSLRSRTTEMHSVLTLLSADERDAVGQALARCLDEISSVVTRQLVHQSPSWPAVPTGSFEPPAPRSDTS